MSGYLALGHYLLEGKKSFADSWNFGPSNENNVTVLELVRQAQVHWDKISFEFDKGKHPHEAGFLMLDSSKAIKLLHWQPVWGFNRTVEQTIEWYKAFYEKGEIKSLEILQQYVAEARAKEISWSKY